MRELTWVEADSVSGGFTSIQTRLNEKYQEIYDTYYYDMGGSVGYQWVPYAYEFFFNPAGGFILANVTAQIGNIYQTRDANDVLQTWGDTNGDGIVDVEIELNGYNNYMGDYDSDGVFETYIGSAN